MFIIKISFLFGSRLKPDSKIQIQKHSAGLKTRNELREKVNLRGRGAIQQFRIRPFGWKELPRSLQPTSEARGQTPSRRPTYSAPPRLDRLTGRARRRNGQPTHVPGIQHPVHRDPSPRHRGRPDDQPSGAAGTTVSVSKQAASLLVRRARLLHAAEPPRLGRHSTKSGTAINRIHQSLRSF